MFYDLALQYDSEARACDLALGDDCDLLIDETPISAILMSIGLDRRAAVDDPLPDGRTQFLAPASYSERRGCPGDALDAAGDLTGSKLWLLNRAKQTETTRELCDFWIRESTAWAQAETGEPAEVEVAWVRDGVLGYRVMIADDSVSLTRRVGLQ